MSNFCPLLFQHLATHPNGSVSHCCIASHVDMLSHSYDGTVDEKTKVYNLNNDSITALYNSESFKKARADMLKGRAPSACNRCFEEEAQGIHSKRQEELRNYPDFREAQAAAITALDGTISDPQFEFVELRLGNTCNVACRTCNPGSSSLWRNDYKKLEETLDFNITSYDGVTGFRWPEQTKFWDDLYEHTNKVKVFYINGGEPMLIKEHFKFLERLVERGHTDVTLWYNINMTRMDDRVLDLWSNFSKVKVGASIDDLGDRNHYIRYPTDWDRVVKNLHIVAANDFIELDITQTVSWMNYTTLVTFWNWATELGIPVSHNPVYDPVFMSPDVLPEDLVSAAWDDIDSSAMPDYMKHKLKSYVNPSSQRGELWPQAQSYTLALDALRKQDIKRVMPEFAPYFPVEVDT